MHIHYFEHKESFGHISTRLFGVKIFLISFGQIFQVVTLKTKKSKDVELLKIRNPWNKKGNKTYETEWQGDWSDKSKLWKLLDLNSRTELPVNRDDGEFWISKDDWLKQFR